MRKRSDMHAKSEKALLNIKEIVKEKTTKSIIERIGHHVVSKVGDNDKIFNKILEWIAWEVAWSNKWKKLGCHTSKHRTKSYPWEYDLKQKYN